MVGHKKENANKLKEIYDVTIQVEGNENIKPGKSELEILETYVD